MNAVLVLALLSAAVGETSSIVGGMIVLCLIMCERELLKSIKILQWYERMAVALQVVRNFLAKAPLSWKENHPEEAHRMYRAMEAAEGYLNRVNPGLAEKPGF